MKLPEIEKADVPEAKIVRYLLSTTLTFSTATKPVSVFPGYATRVKLGVGLDIGVC